jgi:hypothetical protein
METVISWALSTQWLIMFNWGSLCHRIDGQWEVRGYSWCHLTNFPKNAVPRALIYCCLTFCRWLLVAGIEENLFDNAQRGRPYVSCRDIMVAGLHPFWLYPICLFLGQPMNKCINSDKLFICCGLRGEIEVMMLSTLFTPVSAPEGWTCYVEAIYMVQIWIKYAPPWL